jgi:hypothetical protein
MRQSKNANKLCSCIKKVRKTIKARNRKVSEQRAIAICVKSVLHSRGKTIKRFDCKPIPVANIVSKN